VESSKDDDGLRWSHTGSCSAGLEEVVPVDSKGVAKGFRVDAGAGVAVSGSLPVALGTVRR
jgi:hypothetical protein